MALDPKNKGHLFQIEAGTEGRNLKRLLQKN